MTRRAFALPMAILLTLSVGLGIALLMSRLGTQRLAAQRQLDAYQEHHAAMGIMEIVDSWVRSADPNGVAALMGTGEDVLTMTLADGTILALKIGDAQRGALRAWSRLAGEDRDDARAIAKAVREAEDEAGEERPDWWRDTGSAGVSAMSAPEEVLRAVVRSCGIESGANAIVDRIMQARRSGTTLTTSDILQFTIAEKIPASERDKLARRLVPVPELWEVTAELRAAPAPGLTPRTLVRYRGVLTGRSIGGASPGSSKTTGSARTSFHSWERVWSIEEQERAERAALLELERRAG
ncbi:MAG: hypothetical protein RBS39_08910 [Phycisphaerales bacterium]|jgi:hypothetical protein|nr:hypothetical protein [Phycisphaerales bacterium]